MLGTVPDSKEGEWTHGGSVVFLFGPHILIEIPSDCTTVGLPLNKKIQEGLVLLSYHLLVLWSFIVLYFPLEKEINVRARESATQKSFENVFGQGMLEAGLI